MTSRFLPDVVTQRVNMGIVMVAVPSTKPGFNIEIQRTSDDGTGTAASTGAVSIAELPPSQTAGAMFVDHLPDDGAKRFYRGRHTGAGYAPSVNWTAWTTGHRPVRLRIEDMQTLEQTASWPVSREWLPVSSGSISKNLAVPYTLFQPHGSTQPWDTANGYLQPGTTISPLLFRAPLESIPAGALLVGSTGLAAIVYLATSSETLSLGLYRAPTTDPGSWSVMTAVSEIMIPATSMYGQWVELGPIGTTERLTSTSFYELQLSLGNGTTTSPRFSHALLAYTMPTYDVTR